MDSSELSSLGCPWREMMTSDKETPWGPLGDMKRKLRMLYQRTDTVSGLKSARLTCAQPRHSSCWLPAAPPLRHHTFTCSVLAHSLLRGTDKGKFSPKVGFRRSATAFVQQAMAPVLAAGSSAAFICLQHQNNFVSHLLSALLIAHFVPTDVLVRSGP